MPSPILTATMRVGKDLVRNDGGYHFVLCGSSMKRMFNMTDVRRHDNVVIRLYSHNVPKSMPIRIRRVCETQNGFFGPRNFTKVRWTTSKKSTPRAFLLPSATDFIESYLFRNVHDTQTKTVWVCVSHKRKRLDPKTR